MQAHETLDSPHREPHASTRASVYELSGAASVGGRVDDTGRFCHSGGETLSEQQTIRGRATAMATAAAAVTDGHVCVLA